MAMGEYRALFHLDACGKATAGLVLTNIENLLLDLGGKVQVELVANAEGVQALLKAGNPLVPQFERLATQGVRLVACANALRAAGIDKDALLTQAEVVPSGVGELVRRQAEGWAYIRP